MVKLIIFDHDGLMVNSEEIIFTAIRDIFKKYHQNYTREYFNQHIGMSVAESLQIFYKDFPIPITFKEFYNLRNDKVSKYLEKRLQIMDGLIPLLNYIHKLHIPMAIATSGKKDYITKNLNKFGISKYFNIITTIDEVKKGKPHPDLILKTLEKAKTEAKNTIILEDAPNGIEAAHNAGVFSIAIPTKGMDYNRFTKANVLFNNLHQVLDLFKLIQLPSPTEKP
jgi:HAD superfamily hydrolase (TIGR01509 family)